MKALALVGFALLVGVALCTPPTAAAAPAGVPSVAMQVALAACDPPPFSYDLLRTKLAISGVSAIVIFSTFSIRVPFLTWSYGMHLAYHEHGK